MGEMVEHKSAEMEAQSLEIFLHASQGSTDHQAMGVVVHLGKKMVCILID